MVFMLVVVCFAAASHITLISVFVGAGVNNIFEFIEEHNALTKKVIKWTNYIVIICHIGLYIFDEWPFTLFASGLLSHITYYLLLTDFPYFNLTSLSFISSIILLIGNHVFAFKYFQQQFITLSEILSYLTVCLWMIPFMYILYLSANDNTLPVTNVDHFYAVMPPQKRSISNSTPQAQNRMAIQASETIEQRDARLGTTRKRQASLNCL